IDVREHNNEIVFMHRIIPGVANRSYGIHVAKMAGMPETVVARAETVLASLEGDLPKTVQTKSPQSKKTEPKVASPDAHQGQLSLFDGGC
ncbi:MAG: DNA mismatch repair protein MutS, partial [Alphaproteobacteria bacterium]|nr:DNA mismatch repair protein MutS [Alphaproteobacteria bacterium]